MDSKTWKNLVNQKGWWDAYTAYLSSSDWQDKREKRLKIDNNECRTCGNTEDLEIHHKPQAYKRIPNENVNDDLTTLCKECHEAITSLIRQKRYQGRDIKIQNYQMPREAERELISYGLEDREVQINECLPPHSAQWRFGESAESDCETNKVDLWQTQKDGRRFRGIGPT